MDTVVELSDGRIPYLQAVSHQISAASADGAWTCARDHTALSRALQWKSKSRTDCDFEVDDSDYLSIPGDHCTMGKAVQSKRGSRETRINEHRNAPSCSVSSGEDGASLEAVRVCENDRKVIADLEAFYRAAPPFPVEMPDQRSNELTADSIALHCSDVQLRFLSSDDMEEIRNLCREIFPIEFVCLLQIVISLDSFSIPNVNCLPSSGIRITGTKRSRPIRVSSRWQPSSNPSRASRMEPEVLRSSAFSSQKSSACPSATQRYHYTSVSFA